MQNFQTFNHYCCLLRDKLTRTAWGGQISPLTILQHRCKGDVPPCLHCGSSQPAVCLSGQCEAQQWLFRTVHGNSGHFPKEILFPVISESSSVYTEHPIFAAVCIYWGRILSTITSLYHKILSPLLTLSSSPRTILLGTNCFHTTFQNLWDSSGYIKIIVSVCFPSSASPLGRHSSMLHDHLSLLRVLDERLCPDLCKFTHCTPSRRCTSVCSLPPPENGSRLWGMASFHRNMLSLQRYDYSSVCISSCYFLFASTSLFSMEISLAAS